MAPSGNKLLNMLENSGYTVVKVDTKKSASNSTNKAKNTSRTVSAGSLKGGDAFTNNLLGALADADVPIYTQEDIAPVRTTTTTKKKKDDDEDDRKWFQKGAFEDGYQFGDVMKTLLGTAADIAEDVGTGILGVGERVVDLAVGLAPYVTQGQYYQNGGEYQSAQTQKMFNESIDEAKKWSTEFIKKDLYDENEVAKKILSGVGSGAYLANITQNGGQITQADLNLAKQMRETDKAYIDNQMESASVLGEKADSFAQTVGQFLVTKAVAPVVPWQVVTGITSAGSELESALNEGATREEATVSAAVSAGADILGEYFMGGMFGETGLDDAVIKKISRRISNKLLRDTAAVVTKGLGEGLEEEFSLAISRLGKWMTYQDDKTLKELFLSDEAWEEAGEAFLGGFVLGGANSAVEAVKSAKSGVDFASGMTSNEEKVVQKVYEDRVAEAEKNGKVNEKQKSKIYDEVIQEMEKGYISTDTIEEVLGGDAYTSFKSEYDAFFEGDDFKAYKDTTASEKAQIEELEAQLKALENEPDTIGNRNKYNALENQIEQLRNSTKSAELKAKLDAEAQRIGGIKNDLHTSISELVKDSKLAESYRELERSKQKFTADVSKYTNEHAKQTIQNIIDSGVAINTNEFHEFADWLAKISADKNMTFTATDAKRLKGTKYDVEGRIVNGFVDENGNVTLNLENTKSRVTATVGHEITHVLEGTEFYSELQSAIKNYAVSKMGQDAYNARLEAVKKTYEGKGDPDAELTADLVGEYIFSDTDFVRNLSVQHRNVFQKIYDEIKYLCKVATAGSKEARELEKVKKAFEDAYRAEGQAQDGTKYSLSDSDGKQLSQEQQEYFKDSKVRDENGNLLKVYHGSKNSGFNVFEYSEDVQTGTDYGEAYYFTSDRQKASGYSYDVNKDERVARYKNEKDALRDKFLQTRSEEDKNAYLNYKLDGKSLSDLLDDESYLTDGGEVKEVYLNLTNPLIADAGGKYYYEVYPEYFEQARAKGNDGIIVKNVIDNPRGEARPIDTYIAFKQEQIKSVANDKPTSDPDIRFSLSEPVEETKDLIAVHNLHAAELVETLKLSGLPSPSVAIIKAKDGHERYGDVSLILPKDAIDPQANKANRIYGSDAWTPTRSNAQVEYEVDYDTQRQFEKTVEALAKNVANGVFSKSSVLGMAGIEGSTSLNLDDIAKKISDYDAVRAAYVAENGGDVEIVYRTKEFDTYGNNALKSYIDKVGEQEVARLTATLMTGERLTAEEIETAKDAIVEDWTAKREYALKRKPELRDIRIAKFRENLNTIRVEAFIRHAWEFYEDSGATTDEINVSATSDNLRATANRADVKAWVTEKLQGLLSEPGIYNGKDYYTSSGRQRSFKETHWDYTAENIVRAMNNADARGANVWNVSGEAVIATATQEYKNIDEVRADKGRLLKAEQEEYDQIKDDISAELETVTKDIVRTTEHYSDNQYDEEQNIGRVIMEAAQGTKTVPGVKRVFQKEGYRISDAQAKSVLSLFDHASKVPTEYFEAKPQRVVGFDEVGVYVIPNNADVKLKQELLNRGYSIAEYDPNIDGHRQQVVNQFEEYKFSLSNVGEEVDNRYNQMLHPMNYFKYQEDTAPVQDEVVSKTETTTEAELFPDDAYAPVADDPGRFNSLDDADAPPEQEVPYGEEEDIYVDDPFEDRDFFEVGKRNIKAYMYENPEVKPFFQEEALMLGSELADTIKAERWYNDELYSQTGGQKGFGGNKRYTSESIATLLDDWHMSYADIEKGINAIIEDNGAENIAAAKKIEFMLNDRLMNGYKNFYEHGYVEPNAAYLDLIYEKQINEYSKEAFDAFMANADQYAPPVEDVAPVAETAAQSVPMTAPTAVKAETIRPKRQTTGPKMAKATRAEQAAYYGQQSMKGFEPKTAKVLTEEQQVDQKKPKAWNLFKDNIVDKGTVFETMSLKTGNRELQGKWKAIGRAESSAQWFMEHGNASTKSLKDIRAAVEKSGKTKKFSEYLYHMHNVDRMNLESRYPDTENKPVFGYGVTSEMSKAEAAKLEKANPEFKRWAKSVYAYNQAQREMMVENGLISRETADLWAEMYPHYVPVRRVGDEGLNINVALDSKKTGVNAPVKRATGGNRDILPLFDTMAMRTEQTFKAIAKNRFGVELKNMLGTTIDTGTVSVDEMIDSVDMQDSLLQEGKDGGNPTFTVFENGERVTFEITDEIYNTMKPKSELMSYSNKVLNAANNFRRGLLTEYNPAFMLTNPIKDFQDVLINSQHPARTYANVPKAISELWNKNGQYYQEYMEHGGEQSHYFDGEEKTFTKEKTGLSKVVGFPLEKISQVNNFIERVPRMAEYIASRKAGRSIDVSMLDAARVTTDFSAGGDAVKLLNRNGFTFLNASVQGAVQQVRNIREAKYEGAKGWAKLAAKTLVAGLSSELLNHLLWEDDEDYEDLSDYVKQNYYVVAKYDDGKFVRIPKGRTVAVIQEAFKQMGNLITGDDEVDFDTFGKLVISNLAPNDPLENNLFAPIKQALDNRTWYGDDLVPTRLQDLPAAEQYDETTDSISKWLGEKTNTSPYKWNYLLDQYSGAIGDMFLPMLTPEAERGNDEWWGDLIAPITDKFTTDSVLKNQNVTDFYTMRDELEVIANGKNATKEDTLKKVFADAVSWEMSDLYAQKREIQNSDMSDSEKYEAVRELQKKIDELAKNGLGGYEDVYSDGAYAEVGGRRFSYSKEKDTWYEIQPENSDGSENWYYTQEQLFHDNLGVSYADYWNGKFDPATDDVKTHYGEMNGKRYNYSEENNMWYEIKQKNDDGEDNWYYQKEQEVTKGLDIGYEEYWNNREEYNFAYDHPQSYALAKAVGGYKTYMPYYDALKDWTSDTYLASDKDENGDTIYNSRKKKVQAYINDLDIPEIEKVLLYKSVYTGYDDRNYEIIDYLNNRDDLTFEDRVNALRGLGFTVTDDGYISWK